MKCSVPAGFPEFRFAATVLQSSAAQLGVTVEIEELPFVEAITAIKTDKSNCFVLGNANLSPTDATKFFAAHYIKGGFYNSGKFFDPTLQELVAKLAHDFRSGRTGKTLEAGSRHCRGRPLHHLDGPAEDGRPGARSGRRVSYRPGGVHQHPLLGDAQQPVTGAHGRSGAKVLGFLLRRLIWGLLVLLSVAVITFFLSRVVPADPAAFLAGQNASEATVQRIRAEHGLDRPLPAQFVSYMVGLGRGDLGESMRTRRSVSADLAQYLPATLELLLVSFVLYLVISFFLAVLAARRPGGAVDCAIRLLTMVGTGIPVFWLGMTLQFVFFYKLHWLPLGARFPIRESAPPVVTGFLLVDSLLVGSLTDVVAALKHLALPAATIVINLLAVGTRLTRAALIREQDRLYVRTARGKGLSPSRILFKHVLRNALSPILTATTMQFGYMISWVILVEVIFDWPGIGLYAYQSFEVFDYSPVIALALVSTAGFVLINLAMDLLYPIIDPRVQSVGA